MAIRDATPYQRRRLLQPGESIQAVFAAKRQVSGSP